MQKQGHLVHWSRGTLPQQAARREQATHPPVPLTRPGGRTTGEPSLTPFYCWPSELLGLQIGAGIAAWLRKNLHQRKRLTANGLKSASVCSLSLLRVD